MPNLPTSKSRPWLPKPKAHANRQSANAHIYNSRRWRRIAHAHKQEHPLCVHCQEQGILTDATARKGVVDHIIPINEGGAIYDPANLQTLCNSCHNKKSGREAHTNKSTPDDNTEG